MPLTYLRLFLRIIMGVTRPSSQPLQTTIKSWSSDSKLVPLPDDPKLWVGKVETCDAYTSKLSDYTVEF